MKISHKNLATALILVGILAPIMTYADVPSTYTPLAPLPCISGNSTSIGCTVNDKTVANGAPMTIVDVNSYVQYTFNLLIALAAVAAVFMITWGGFEYMTSVAPGSKTDGLGKVRNAIYGLLLVLCSFLILKAINPQFVQVPQGLVAPLDICKTNPSLCTNMLSTWAAQLQSQQANFDAQQKTDLQQASDLINQNITLVSDSTTLASDIVSLTNPSYANNIAQACKDFADDENVAADCAEWQTDQVAIQNNKNSSDLLSGEANFASLASKSAQAANTTWTGALNMTNTTNALNDLQTAYNTTKNKLESEGVTSDQIQPLTDTYNSTDGQIRLIEANNINNGGFSDYASPNISTEIKDFNTIVNTDTNSSTEATLTPLSVNQAMDDFATKYYDANKVYFTQDFSAAVNNATTPQEKLDVINNLSKYQGF